MTYCNGCCICIKRTVIQEDKICKLKIYLNKFNVTFVN